MPVIAIGGQQDRAIGRCVGLVGEIQDRMLAGISEDFSPIGGIARSVDPDRLRIEISAAAQVNDIAGAGNGNGFGEGEKWGDESSRAGPVAGTADRAEIPRAVGESIVNRKSGSGEGAGANE